jgi:hypothetical protein
LRDGGEKFFMAMIFKKDTAEVNRIQVSLPFQISIKNLFRNIDDHIISFWIPSGKLTVCYIENDNLEIVDLPMKNDFPEQNVSYVNVYQRVSCTILYHLSLSYRSPSLHPLRWRNRSPPEGFASHVPTLRYRHPPPSGAADVSGHGWPWRMDDGL